MSRRYLFLQGPVGPFFQELGRELSKQGSQVWKVNFNGGDKFFWQNANGIDYKSSITNYEAFIKNVIKENEITDLVVYGDCRPVHKIAIEALQGSNVKIHVFEEGYFRPDWITLEENGVNARSSLPREREFYDNLTKGQLPKPIHFNPHFRTLIWYSTLYYIHTVKNMYGKFKHYRHHFNISPHITIARWVWKFFTRRHKPWQTKSNVKKILQTKYFLVPLQLCRDYQIKEHSQFCDMTEFVDLVLQDFVNNASQDNVLVFKIHPLDNNPARLEKYIAKSAKTLKADERVYCLDGGHLPTLVKNSRGVVVANSTSGLVAISNGVPTIALSEAVYNIPGLTFEGSLQEFWKRPKKPNSTLYNKFANFVISRTQRNGNYYDSEGIKAAVKNSSEWLLHEEPEIEALTKIPA